MSAEMLKAKDTPHLDARPSKSRTRPDRLLCSCVADAHALFTETEDSVLLRMDHLTGENAGQTVSAERFRFCSKQIPRSMPKHDKLKRQNGNPETVPMTTWLCEMDNVLFTTCGLPQVLLPLCLELLVADPVDEIPRHLVHPKMLTCLLRRVRDADDNDQKCKALLPSASLAKDSPLSYEDLSGLFVDMFRFNKATWSGSTDLHLPGLLDVAMKTGRVEVWSSFRRSGVLVREWFVNALSSSAGWRLAACGHDLVRDALAKLPFAHCLIADIGLVYHDFICEGAFMDGANFADWINSPHPKHWSLFIGRGTSWARTIGNDGVLVFKKTEAKRKKRRVTERNKRGKWPVHGNAALPFPWLATKRNDHDNVRPKL